MDYRKTKAVGTILQKVFFMKGGKRKGAGRKPAPYKTKAVAFRVREQWVDKFKDDVRKLIKSYKDETKR